MSTELPPNIHLVGVGGAGMSAIAKLLSGLGHVVTGSDQRGGAGLAQLGDLGLDVWTGSKPDAIEAADLVVASSAVPDSDPELEEARRLGIRVWRRPQLLGSVTALMPAIGATGTHGKTSSTAMAVTALLAAGRDPSFLVGGELKALRTNAHLGDRDLFVLEADEAFGTFQDLHLRALMVTNIEPEHLDHYGSIEVLSEAFEEVVGGVSGPVVIGVDDAGARGLADRTGMPTYGLAADAVYRAQRVDAGALGSRFSFTGPGVDLAVRLSTPGLHMVSNAVGVLALLNELGEDVASGAQGLANYEGVRRRFEHRGSVGGVSFIDDYAHHPTEVAANVAAARRGDWRKIWAVFQPHLYSRTRRLYRDFGAALSVADEVVVTDVFGAREAPEPGITGELVAEAASASGAMSVSYVPHRAELAEFLLRRVGEGDLVLSMGAGDITTLADELAPLLATPA